MQSPVRVSTLTVSFSLIKNGTWRIYAINTQNRETPRDYYYQKSREIRREKEDRGIPRYGEMN